jgi:hypothetical protein
MIDLKPVRMQAILRVSHHLNHNWASVIDHEPGLRFGALQTLAHAAPSTIHGTGLFASDDLAAGTVVTLYPTHALGDSKTCLTCDLDGLDAEHFGAGGSDWPYRVDLPVSPRLSGWAEDLWIDTNPAREATPGWLGHLVNEGVVCQGGEDEQICDYYVETLERANCFLLPFGDTPLMCWATTADVKRGDELLGVYGHDYWLGRELGAVPPYTPRVLAAAKEWKDALQACRKQVQQDYKAEVAGLRGLFEFADADAQEMARGAEAPRGRASARRTRRTSPPKRKTKPSS